MIPANLIVNADDFGLDPRVSKAIALCLDEGLINSFSVYPFHDGFHAGLLRDILARHPRAGVGAHLAVSGPGLREHAGHFRDVLARMAAGRLPVARVRGMWRSQIEGLQDRIGRGLSHLDSHQHLHLLPGLWRAARSLQAEFGIPRLRVPYESLARSLGHRFPFGFAMQSLARLRLRETDPAFIGFFTSMRFTVAANRAALERAAREPSRRCELMVHPILSDDPREAAQAAEIGELRKLAAAAPPS